MSSDGFNSSCHIIALVDCNNFFVSCERLFNPSLMNRPVVVLSNNDGCVISRSNEAKLLGIPMGAPYFKFKQFFTNNKVSVLSSNYELYSDMSKRVLSALRYLCPTLEVYSVDEAFLQLNSFKNVGYENFAWDIFYKIKKWTGIPVSIGIGHTKTLAKVANSLAKKGNGVFSILDPILQEEILNNFSIEDIWGIGRKWSTKLRLLGIGTAKTLRDTNPKMIRKNFSVVGERVLYELRGLSCLSLEEIPKHKKNIISSRSFGKDIKHLHEIEEALSGHIASASYKLRKQNSLASEIGVFLTTNYFKTNLPQYSNKASSPLTFPTNDTRIMISAAKLLLSKIFKNGYFYKKVGVVLLNLIPNPNLQPSLTSDFTKKDSSNLIEIIDNINEKMGRNTLFLAAQGIDRSWKMRCDHKSPCFTTNWEELLTIK